MSKPISLIIELKKLRKFYFIGFDICDAPNPPYSEINKEIKSTFKNSVRHVLDTTWIYSGFGYTSADELYKKVNEIIKNHVTSKKANIYLMVWELSKNNCKGVLRTADANWINSKLN